MLDLSQYKPGDPLTLKATYDCRLVNDAAIFARVSGHVVLVSPQDILSIAPATDAPETGTLRGLLWYAWTEMNAIRARDGVPRDYHGYNAGIDPQYWSDLVDKMSEALGRDAMPWPSEDAKAIFPPADEP